jgi:hypothetical protein
MSDLQEQCDLGQRQLMRMEYLQAEATLAGVLRDAMNLEDWDTVARACLPLQEARRQRRQTCALGTVRLDILASGPDDHLEVEKFIEQTPRGQLLVAGWGSIEPALRLRQLQAQHQLYAETFLAAVYPLNDGHAIVVIPLEELRLPDPQPCDLNQLKKALPPNCLLIQNPKSKIQNPMFLWEQLHTPFLASADEKTDVSEKIAGYLKTIEVDYACELAHQGLADSARELGRRKLK